MIGLGTKKKKHEVDLGEKGSFHVHEGGLHEYLGIPKDEKIPASKLEPTSSDTEHGKHMKASAKGFKAMKH